MAHLRSLPEDATLRDVFATYADQMLHLNGFAEAVMRGPCQLSEGERELIAAYVSGLNACTYCLGVHAATAGA
ncbi:MAG: carboxymuconolactone decarboxylase family protein, partial [Alphaproteobacteria bacterium]